MNSPSKLIAFALISGSLVASILLRWLLDPWLGNEVALSPLFGAVAVAVWVGGYLPAILVTAIGYMVCSYLFTPPRGELSFTFPRDIAAMAICAFSSAIIIALGEAMRASRRRAQRSIEQLQVVTRGAAAPITRCRRNLTYAWVNDAFARWIGRPADELVGLPIAEVIGQTSYEQLLPYFKRVLTGQVVNYEECVEFPGLGPRWISATYSPTYDDLGNCDGWVAIVIDIDDRKQSEVQLQTAQNALMLVNESLRAREDTLREADRRKDEFLAILAHELRNPLAPIGYATQVLGKDEVNASDLNWVRNVLDRQVQQMGRLLDDLLDVARITRGTFELRLERVSLRTVLNDAIEGSRPLIEKSGHMLAIDIAPEPITLDADPTRLAQVFLNLLNNAAKYTEGGGAISLTARMDGDHVTVTVKDNGIGIPPEMLGQVFDMFAQEDRSLERSHGGLGIGLTLAHRLVTMHRGTIQVRSAGRGHGSEFTVRMPAVIAAADGEETPAPMRIAPEFSPVRVLVADDNRDSVHGMARLFTSLGHVVCTAFDGRSAVEQAASFRPGLAILDIGMPNMNGYDAAAAIRQLFGRDVVLVALTGWGQDEDRRRSKEAGFDYHLTKPAAVEKLVALLETTHRKGMTRVSHPGDNVDDEEGTEPDSRGASAVQ